MMTPNAEPGPGKERTADEMPASEKMAPSTLPLNVSNHAGGSPGSTVNVPNAAWEAVFRSFQAQGYEILGELGRGGMGVVYRAKHVSSGQFVALKTLQKITPETLYRFKKEFRVVAELAHSNIITLRELVSDGDEWFFTMELIEGLDFATHVRGGSPPGRLNFRRPETESRLRSSLHQLATGLHALHTVGILHRDIKPGNVIVTGTDRVVLLDFGLAAELVADGVYSNSPTELSGTVAYMAPEQAACKPLTAAADWYAVGVILYELLTGQLPFSGSVLSVLNDKQNLDPPSPLEINPQVPPRWNKFCLGLLHRDPTQRPLGDEVLRELGDAPTSIPHIVASKLIAKPQLVGRDQHLQLLVGAVSQVREGTAVCARVSGPSGAGKSALAMAFLDHVADGQALVLAGRCYEQEMVPYKAFDGIIDALTHYLLSLSDQEVASVIPQEAGALIRLFPVMGQLPGVREAPSSFNGTPDPREIRRRGIAVLRELLARLAKRQPLILFIDDFHWGDVDSAVLLNELLRPPSPPGVMLLISYRSEDVERIPTLQMVHQVESIPAVLHVIDVTVGPLSNDETRSLAQDLAGSGSSEEFLDLVVRDAAGNPFYVEELIAASRVGLAIAGMESLDGMLWNRSRGLPVEAQHLIEVLAVAGRPVPREILQRATGLDASFYAAQGTLRAERMLRGTGAFGDDVLAPYHDRVREAILANLSPEDKRTHHKNLALTLETAGEQDAEFLAIHFHGAGEDQTAGRYYAEAGATAATATAFDQAARLYRLAADVATWSESEEARLRMSEADALANAGRGASAAEVYLDASELGDGDASREWRRRAAEQYLITGHMDVGLEVLRDVLTSARLTMPNSLLSTVLRLLAGQARLRLRGTRFRLRDPATISRPELHRIDVCWSASTGLTVTDFIRGAYFHTVGLRCT